MKSLFKLLPALLFLSCGETNRVQQYDKPANLNNSFRKRPDLRELNNRFTKFHNDSTAIYFVSLCADIPYNKNPGKVLYRKQPGHVFLIFSQKLENGDTLSQVFGFYPIRPASTVIFKNVKSEIRDNSGREYDVQVMSRPDKKAFYDILDSAIAFGRKKYNLNHYNCYDYGLRLFNLTIPAHPIPVEHVRFPFIWGKGGSPVGLYRTLLRLKQTDSLWAQRIEFGQLKA